MHRTLMLAAMLLVPGVAPSAVPIARPPKLARADVWKGSGVRGCGSRSTATTIVDCVVKRMRRSGATPGAITFARWLAREDGSLGYVSGWRRAGPIGIGTLTFPFRANTNDTEALIPASGRPILLERWGPSAADKARADWRAFARAHPDASPFPPGEVSVPKLTAGRPITIRLSLPMRTCHACTTLGHVVVGYRFDASGRFVGDAVEDVG